MVNRALILLMASLLALAVACGDNGGGDDNGGTNGTTPTNDSGSTAELIAQTCVEGPGLAADLSPDQLLVGVLVPGTGAQASVGLDYVNAANLAAKCLNNAGGINGAPVVILTGDTMSDEATAVAEADRLVNVEGVVAVVGDTSNEITIAVAEDVTIPAGVLQISPSQIEEGAGPADDQDLLFSLPEGEDGDSGDAFDEMFVAEYGDLYTSPSVRQVFDAIVLVGLAAQASAANIESAAIRDSLRDVANEPGDAFGPTEDEIIAALAALVGGGDIDYQGASGSISFE